MAEENAMHLVGWSRSDVQNCRCRLQMEGESKTPCRGVGWSTWDVSHGDLIDTRYTLNNLNSFGYYFIFFGIRFY